MTPIALQRFVSGTYHEMLSNVCIKRYARRISQVVAPLKSLIHYLNYSTKISTTGTQSSKLLLSEQVFQTTESGRHLG
jgi:hypothetical protein